MSYVTVELTPPRRRKAGKKWKPMEFLAAKVVRQVSGGAACEEDNTLIMERQPAGAAVMPPRLT